MSLAERQNDRFGRVYGYSLASIFFFHFTINIGMVQGTINLLSKVGTVAAFLLFVSCDSLFHQYRGVGGCWALSDTLTFTYTPTNEEKQNCRLDIELRSSNDYKYKEIFLRVERFSKRQKETVVDTLRCELYDDLGHTRGTTAGILWQTSFPVDTIEILPNVLEYVFESD